MIWDDCDKSRSEVGMTRRFANRVREKQNMKTKGKEGTSRKKSRARDR